MTTTPAMTARIEAGVVIRERSLAAVCVGVLLMALGLFFIAKFSLTNRSILVQVEQVLLLAYTSARAAMCIRAVKPRIVTLIAWLWTYSLFGLVQTVQLSQNLNPFRVPAPDSNMSRQLLIVLIGLLAMDVASSRARVRTVTSDWQPRTLSLRATTVASVLMLLSTPFFVSWLGGISSLFGSRLAISLAIRSSNQSPSTTSVILLATANVGPFICAFALWKLRLAGQYTFRKRPDLAAIFGLLIVANILLNNPISMPRFWIATIVIAVVIGGRRLQSVAFQVVLVAAYIVVSVVIFPYLDITRYTTISQATIESSSLSATYVDKTDYGSAQDVTNAITHVDMHGHTDGRQLLGALFFFVPRDVWPDKPTDTAKLLAADIGFANTNLDSPLWAEGYIDFGIPGVVIVLALFGTIIGKADRSFIGGVNQARLTSVLVPSFAGYELLLMRGSLLQAMGRLSLLLVIGLVISRRTRQQAP